MLCLEMLANFCWLWCRRMWMLLQVHAKQCQRSDCPVPRCKELREMRRRAVVRQEDQRRVAYKNMVRCCALSFPWSLWLLWPHALLHAACAGWLHAKLPALSHRHCSTG